MAYKTRERLTDRPSIEAEIVREKAKHDRLPAHFTAQRDAIMFEIECLVDDWLEAKP